MSNMQKKVKHARKCDSQSPAYVAALSSQPMNDARS